MIRIRILVARILEDDDGGGFGGRAGSLLILGCLLCLLSFGLLGRWFEWLVVRDCPFNFDDPALEKERKPKKGMERGGGEGDDDDDDEVM